MNIGIVISPSPELSNSALRKQIPEPLFYEKLTEYGNTINQFVYVFKACDFNKRKMNVMGYRFEGGQWKRVQLPLPDFVIDRTFHHSSLQAQRHSLYMKQLSQLHSFLTLNAQLPNKLVVYEQLQKMFPELIPPSQHYDSFHTFEKLLDEYNAGVILKPLSGMHGKGIIHIIKSEQHFKIYGRQLNNQPVCITFSNRIALQKWLLYFRQNMNFLIQPYYEFRTATEKPFDIRVLMQKDKHGNWQNSGHVARVGHQDHLTSNLHGGGKRALTNEVLAALFNNKQVAQLLTKIHMISGQIVNQLEAHFGRFGEIALDFGITKQGNIVLLECNSKPGRQAFLEDATQAEHVISNPLLYANYLFQHYKNAQKINFQYKSTSTLL